MDSASHHPRVRLGRLIAENSGEIERRWLDRVRKDLTQQADVELTQLRDGIPDYLSALAKALTTESPRLADDARSAWSDVARAHGITRVRIGFDISQLVHEFIVLRAVISDFVTREEKSGDSAEGVLSALLDTAIAVAVQSYVAARDYEARRVEAENVGFLIHELRLPLQTAVLASGRLRRRLPAEQATDLDAIDRSLRRLGELIEKVLLAERLAAGEATPAPTETTLARLLEPVEAIRGLAEEKRLKFRLAYDPDARVTVDEKLTQSAIQNLADNAVKYTDMGGVAIDVERTHEELVIDVRDTCRGLSAEELATIFEPFKRGRSHKTGAGLGLAIARRAVETQGGTIMAESPDPTGGCHFQIRLPAIVRPANGGSSARSLR